MAGRTARPSQSRRRAVGPAAALAARALAGLPAPAARAPAGPPSMAGPPGPWRPAPAVAGARSAHRRPTADRPPSPPPPACRQPGTRPTAAPGLTARPHQPSPRPGRPVASLSPGWTVLGRPRKWESLGRDGRRRKRKIRKAARGDAAPGQPHTPPAGRPWMAAQQDA